MRLPFSAAFGRGGTLLAGATSAVKDPQSDLVDYVAEHLGIDRSEALSRLGDWLSAYEPMRRRRIQVLTPVTGSEATVCGPSAGSDS